MYKRNVQHKLPVILFSLIAAGISLRAAPPRAWAIQDSLRVDPISGRALEANRMIFPDAMDGDYKKSNLIWNGAERRISLRAARNEIVAFQLMVERDPDAELTNVRIGLRDLESKTGGVIPVSHIDLFKQWYVNLLRQTEGDYSLGTGWYPDALIPCLRWSGRLFPSTYILPFDIPDRLNNIGARQTAQGLWVDIYVPPDREKTPPGVYQSVVTVSSDQGSVELELALEVWDFALPEESHLKGNIHADTEINTFTEELELKYYQMIRRHRLALGVLGYAPDLKVEGRQLIFDWTAYDARLGKYLDGSAFTTEYGYQGPGAGVPIEFLVLPFDSEPMNVYKTERRYQLAGKEFKFYRGWPVPLPKEGITEEYKDAFRTGFREFQAHLDANPRWTRTQPVVFFLSLDEAYNEESYEKMILYAALLQESGANRLRFRIDGWYPSHVLDRLADYIDIVILGAGGYEADRVAALRKRGVEDWFYTGASILDRDALGQRALSWVCWKYEISSWTLWELDFNALRAWFSPETYVTLSGKPQNGSGMLVYRGETVGLDEPVASIRLKVLRRGAQDFEYFRLLSRLEGGRDEVKKLVDSIIHNPMGQEASWGAPGMWNHDPDDWERVRLQIGDRLNGLIREGRTLPQN